MSPSDLEIARERLRHTPGLPYTILDNLREIGGRARTIRSGIDALGGPQHSHPELEADVVRHIAAAGAIGAGPEQLLSLEGAYAALTEAVDREEAELQRRAAGARQARTQADMAARCEVARLDAARKATAATRATMTNLRAALDAAEVAFHLISDDADLLAAVASIEESVELAARALSAERRVLRPRVAKLMADRAAADIAKAA